MSSYAALNNKQQNKSVPQTVPAPVGGWNTRETIGMMPVTDCIEMDNWFPGTNEVTLRAGYTPHQTVSSGNAVEMLTEFHSGTTRKLLAAANGNIYDATGTPSSLASGFTSNRWQTTNFNSYIFFVNGVDAPQDWNGTTWTATAWTGTGLTITDLNNVMAFKTRLFFSENNSQSFWYGGVNAVTGTLTEFPLSRVGNFGGTLKAMGSWTIDGGSGPDDYAVFFMSSGEVIVYQGTDPSSASTWSLVGVYRIAEPVNVRGVIEVGGDIIVITRDDYVSISQVLRTGQVGEASKLSGAVKGLAAEMDNFGWQATLYRKGNMMIFNHTDVGNYRQHVVNTLTGSACRFTGIPALCWGVYDNDLYFGAADGVVYMADTGSDDNGDPIEGDATQAWNDFSSPYRKALRAIRVVIKSQGDIEYGVNVGFDFKDPSAPAVTAKTSASSSLWDVALWDVALWGAGFLIKQSWRVKGGTGQCLATRVKVSGLQPISWLRTDYRIEPGSNL